MAAYLGCNHEALYDYPDYADFMDSDCKGDSTTCYPWISEYIEGHRQVFIHRPVHEVEESIRALFGHVDIDLEYHSMLLRDGIGLHVEYHEINDRLEEICDYIGVEYDEGRNEMIHQNIQNFELIGRVQSCLY